MSSLQAAFGSRLGRFSAIGPWQVVNLTRKEAQRQTANRTVLLGNAARLLHPVAGQGYNLAVRDAKVLTELLAKQRLVTKNSDPGSATMLDAFVAARAADQQQTVRLTDWLARGFRGHAALPAHLRALSLVGLDQISPLRQRFARMSMGFSQHGLG